MGTDVARMEKLTISQLKVDSLWSVTCTSFFVAIEFTGDQQAVKLDFQLKLHKMDMEYHL